MDDNNDNLNEQNSNAFFKDRNKEFNPIINNSLDYNMQLIKPAWENANPSFNRAKENIRYVTYNEENYINVNDILTNMDFYTQDIRLSNYSNEDVVKVRWWLEFAGKCASKNYFKAFSFCLMQVANMSETSQGKGGFLRKSLNTFRQESVNSVLEPTKRSLFTGKVKNNEGGN